MRVCVWMIFCFTLFFCCCCCLVVGFLIWFQWFLLNVWWGMREDGRGVQTSMMMMVYSACATNSEIWDEKLYTRRPKHVENWTWFLGLSDFVSVALRLKIILFWGNWADIGERNVKMTLNSCVSYDFISVGARKLVWTFVNYRYIVGMHVSRMLFT